ncbi:MAG TPA: aspartate aminotransferase family protein [Usitatibacter sp.]|jgi:acetylornithine/succinyldiaminopimelate/putrescine aminotransferase|nr:aspartate aminotransferase family protein [Usitatibacter sp.]
MPASRVAHEESPELRIARSRGDHVFDTRGRRYIDFLMGWCVGNFGWGNAVIERPAKAFRGPDYVYPNFDYPPWEELASLLLALAPRPLAKCFRATGGSEAVDLALQAAMLHTGRRAFISLEGAYHGNTLGALSVGSGDRERLRNLLGHCRRVKPPLDHAALARFDRELARGDVAAVILEPISMNLGVLIPERGFMGELGRLCRAHGTLLIMDEVAIGFGRSGTLFASEQVGARPDILTLAKAVTDGVGGLGAMLATARVARSMEADGVFYSTYGWHPRSTAIAIATLRYIERRQDALLDAVAATSDYFRARLEAMELGDDAEIRIRGLAIGVDLHDEKRASKVGERCRRAGLLVSPEDTTVLLIPALNIRRATAKKGLDILERCMVNRGQR